MVSTPARGATALWPPDDTEESIVGVDRHQLDIISLRMGINEEAHRVAGGGALPWQAISQILLLGCRRPDGSAYPVYPDVFVYPRPMERTRGSYTLAKDGAPVLVVEVASESTHEADLDLARGKGWSYARAGVAEYLALDPTGVYVPEGGRGWRLVGGAYQPWRPDGRGRWVSAEIGVALGIDDGLAAVYGAAGRRHLREGEVEAARERAGQEGRQEGRQEGKREALRRLARQRFGVVAALEERISTAAEPQLDQLLDRVIGAATPDDL